MPDWRTVKANRHSGPARHSMLAETGMSGHHHDRQSPKTSKVNKAKGQASGRTYTSKYRGVHQTFPTKRWEAQFRCARAALCAAPGAPGTPLLRPGASAAHPHGSTASVR